MRQSVFWPQQRLDAQTWTFGLYHFVQSDLPGQVQICCYREGYKRGAVYRVTDVMHGTHKEGGCELQVGFEGIAMDVKWTEIDENHKKM